jgi:ABC-type enterochelin transport system ATPase subunit
MNDAKLRELNDAELDAVSAGQSQRALGAASQTARGLVNAQVGNVTVQAQDVVDVNNNDVTVAAGVLGTAIAT